MSFREKMLRPNDDDRVTLLPGETAHIDLRNLLEPDVYDAVRRGELEIRTEEGRVRFMFGRYHREVRVLIEGRPHAKMMLSWEAPPPSRFRQFLGKLFRR